MKLDIYKIDKQTGYLEPFPNSALPSALYSFNYDCKRMGNAPTITGTIMYPLCLDNYWTEDVCVVFKGEKYFIENIPSSSYSNQDARYKHEITFVSERKKLEKVYFKDRLNTNTKNKKPITEFSFFGDLSVFVAKLNDCLSHSGDNVGYKASIDSNIITEEKNIVIDNMYILEALQHAVEEYGVPYYIQGKEIHFGECQNEITTPLKYGVDNALLSVQRENTNNLIINKITGVGSSENIPYYYPNFNESGEHEVTTEPANLIDNIKPINYLKVDPYTRLREGGSATYYKATVNGLGRVDTQGVVITVNNVQYEDYKCAWTEEWDALYRDNGDGTSGYYVDETIDLSLSISVNEKINERITIDRDFYIQRAYNEPTHHIFELVSATGYYHSNPLDNTAIGIDNIYYNITQGSETLTFDTDKYFKIEFKFKYRYIEIMTATVIDMIYAIAYNTHYVSDKNEVRVENKNNTITESNPSYFYKKIEFDTSKPTYSDTFVFAVVKAVSGYTDFRLDTAFRANYYGDSQAKKFYPSIKDISVYHNRSSNPLSFKVDDNGILHCRNNTAQTLVFTVFAQVNVNISYPNSPNISDKIIELTYVPDFTRHERNNDVWKFHDGKEVSYDIAGIKFYNLEDAPDSSKVIFSPTINWIDPKQNLMPYKYRETIGKDMFYLAENDTYKDDKGAYIKFPNPFRDAKKSELVAEPKEDIKPTIVGVTNARGERIDMFADVAFDELDNNKDWKDVDEDTEELEHSFFFVKLRKTDGDDGFNLFEQSIENGEMVISMTNGQCGSCNFTIMVDDKNYKNPVQVDENGDLVRDENGNVVIKTGSPQDIQQDTSQAEVWIALKKSEDDYGIILPDKESGLVPTTRDNFVITNILLPNQYIVNAEKKLEKELIAELLENNDDKFEYSIELSRIFLAENEDIANALNENSAITFQYNDVNYRMYVSSYSYKMDSNTTLPNIKIEITKELTITKNKLQVLEDKVVKKVEYISASGIYNTSNERGGGNSNIKVVQETGSSKENVMSQKAVTKAVNDVIMDTNDSLEEIREEIKNLNINTNPSNVNIVQNTGQSANSVMSQKAVTDTFGDLTSYLSIRNTNPKTSSEVTYDTTTELQYQGDIYYFRDSSMDIFLHYYNGKYYAKWYNSYLYNEELSNGSIKAKKNLVIYVTETKLYYTTSIDGWKEFIPADISAFEERVSDLEEGLDNVPSQLEFDALYNDVESLKNNISDASGILHFDGITDEMFILNNQASPSTNGKILFSTQEKKFVYFVDNKYYAGFTNYEKYNQTTGDMLVIPNKLFNYNEQIYTSTESGELKTLSELGIDITIAQSTGSSTTSVMSQKAVTDEISNINGEITDINSEIVDINSDITTINEALAGKLEVINASPYFKSTPDFSNNTVVTCNVNDIPCGPKIAYEFTHATPKPLLAFYDSGNKINNTFVYKGFMTNPLRFITITFNKDENKATIKVINIIDESSSIILNVKGILAQRPTTNSPDYIFDETRIQESHDGEVYYCFDTNYNTSEFLYKYENEDGILIFYKKWYNSYLYNDESTGIAHKNILFYCEDLNSYFTIREGKITPIEFLDYKFNKSDIATTLGSSEKKVMSQKAVTDALAGKIDKNDFETKLEDKLSIVNLTSNYNLEFIKDSNSNGAYRTEYNLSEIFNNIDYKNVIFTIFSPRLADTTTSNVIVLENGETLHFSFAKRLQEKYYYNTTAINLELYNGGEVGVFKKYTSALITLVLDIQENILELYLEDANNFEKLEVEKDNYKIVIDPHFIYSQHGGDNIYNTSQIYLEPERISIGGSGSGEGAVLEGLQEVNGHEVNEVYLYRNSNTIRKEGIKLSDSKVKFFRDIDIGEELPINVTGIADPTTEFDAVNKRYVDSLLGNKASEIALANDDDTLNISAGETVIIDSSLDRLELLSLVLSKPIVPNPKPSKVIFYGSYNEFQANVDYPNGEAVEVYYAENAQNDDNIGNYGYHEFEIVWTKNKNGLQSIIISHRCNYSLVKLN